MLLPYRLASYKLRGSRVAIEAMTRGIPIVTTFGTALAEQSKKYGAAVLFENNDVEDLVNAIRQADENFKELKIVAQQRKQFAQTHFSVANFREILNQI
jgi:glycosyltransferase involved in cell wall biosynthesis